MSQPEHRSVREERLLLGIIWIDPSRRVLCRMPSVEMSIEMDDSDISVDPVQRAEGGKGNGMITSESKKLGSVSIRNR